MDSFTRSLSPRYVSSSPPPNRTGGFHRIRLSPFGPSPRIREEPSFPFPQHPPCMLGGQLARALRTFGPAHSHRLGAFASSPPPGVHGFPVLRLLCPLLLP